MVDVDGVILIPPAPHGWSTHLERDLGLAPTVLQEAFFKPHFADIVAGRAGLRERLEPVLASIAPQLTAERLIGYWFEHDFHPDEDLLAALAQVRAGGFPVSLATVQEHERARYLWETRALNQRFDALHYSAELGAVKPQPEFYAVIEARTGLTAGELAFIDDKAVNVEAARERGWRAEVWTGEQTLDELLPELFSVR